MNAEKLIHSKTSYQKLPKGNSQFFDPWFAFAAISIIVLGLIMVASASIITSENLFADPFHFLLRQIIYLTIGFCAGFMVLKFELDFWQKQAGWLLILSFLLLSLVLIPGIGREVNGSMRWVGVGPIGMQVSELAKLFAIIYLADYLVRRNEEVKQQAIGFIKPMLLFVVMAILLLKEPDFGTATVIICTALGMLFLAGVRLTQFAILFGTAVVGLAAIAISSPYRMARLTSFLNPWANAYDSGYQLTQSLIAFGRGGWFGVGLGASVQKLFYLPEAHTDFLFAVLAEELGLLGVLLVIALFVLLVVRAFRIGYKAQIHGRLFSAYLAFGLALWMAIQAVINIGVNSGLLPTKGLTLPLMSYGGSSMIVMCVVIALLFRIDFETRIAMLKDYKCRLG